VSEGPAAARFLEQRCGKFRVAFIAARCGWCCAHSRAPPQSLRDTINNVSAREWNRAPLFSFTMNRIPAPLDPAFQPAVLFHRQYVENAKASGRTVPLVIALEREGGWRSRYETVVTPDNDRATQQHVERILKFLLWSRGGWKIFLGGPRAISEHIQKDYSPTGARAFDADLMRRVYERPLEVMCSDASAVPAEKESHATAGGHLDGCRLGFDLGASDYKVAAVQNGEVLFSSEFPWNPREQPDPEYHYAHLSQGLKQAAARLPRVDAIGGSSAGVIVDNQIRVASLFRAVPAAQFDRAKNIFLRLRDEWRVPLEVANDGDVTALAGAMSLNVRGVLGIALGSSQAAGYLNAKGAMTGWLNELAFAPVDYNPSAPTDEWSGDRGVGVSYFSQQAVNRLLPAANIPVPADMDLPERLKTVQSLLQQGDPRAAKIYETLGVYLGYTIPHYADFYDLQHVLILGRVTSGAGGDIVLQKARAVINEQFPETAAKIQLHVPDERMRRVGQAVAAASLPGL
jgi:predicted NBD/HSP70 family sugar kinase